MLLILAGVSLKLISGSNGILGKAEKAVKLTQVAKFNDAKELADGEMQIKRYTNEGEKKYASLYDYISKKCDQNSDKKVPTSGSEYSKDSNEMLHYNDKDTGYDGLLVHDKEGNLIIKQITNDKGDKQDMTTSETIKKEIEGAIAGMVKEYQEKYGRKDQEKSFEEYIEEKCQETGKDYVEVDNGGKVYPDGNGHLFYHDILGNDTKFIATNDGEVFPKEMTTPDGEIKDMTTESTLQREIEESVKKLKEEHDKSGSTVPFDEWLRNKCEENGGSISTITGGTIEPNEDGSFKYSDSTIPPNTGDFTVDGDGKVNIKDTTLNKPSGEDNDKKGKTEEQLKEELEKAIKDLKDEKNKSGNTDPFDQWLKDKCDPNGGKIPTITGGTIEPNEDGSFTYKDGENPPNEIDFTVDTDGNITIIEIRPNTPGDGGNKVKPNINLTAADITFTYSPSEWTNGDVTVKAKPNIDTTGYIIQTSRNGVVWNNTDSQTFTQNGTFYVRLYNNGGSKYGGAAAANVENIDKLAPEASLETSSKTNSVNIIASATDQEATAESGKSGIKEYCFSKDNGSNWTSYASGISGAIATGGPTLDQFWTSYNKKYGTNDTSSKNNTITQEDTIERSRDTLYFLDNTVNGNLLNDYWLVSNGWSSSENVARVSRRGTHRGC